MSKIKVGDYVRTRNLGGSIEKIIEILPKEKTEDLITRYTTDVSAKYSLRITENEIIKSSSNIIDLIEVGDYVNGHYVTKVELTPNEEVYKVIWTSTCDGMDGETLEIRKEEIESIVTKEQFESIEYKVK